MQAFFITEFFKIIYVKKIAEEKYTLNYLILKVWLEIHISYDLWSYISEIEKDFLVIIRKKWDKIITQIFSTKVLSQMYQHLCNDDMKSN